MSLLDQKMEWRTAIKSTWVVLSEMPNFMTRPLSSAQNSLLRLHSVFNDEKIVNQGENNTMQSTMLGHHQKCRLWIFTPKMMHEARFARHDLKKRLFVSFSNTVYWWLAIYKTITWGKISKRLYSHKNENDLKLKMRSFWRFGLLQTKAFDGQKDLSIDSDNLDHWS